MSTLIAPIDRSARASRPSSPSGRERRAERRRLKHLDALSAQLAELYDIRALLERAAEVVGTGWVQGAWFVVETPGGKRQVTAYDLRLAADRPVVGACMVGAVVHAAGGPSTVRSQLVQRTLDLTWHTLREGPDQPVRWSPGPRVRMMTVLDLTHWNDTPGRTDGEVTELLHAAGRTAEAQRVRCLEQQAALSPVGEPLPSG